MNQELVKEEYKMWKIRCRKATTYSFLDSVLKKSTHRIQHKA